MAAKRKSKFEKQVDGLVEKFYRQHGQGVQIDVMDIGKIYAAGLEAATAAQATEANLEGAVEQAVIAAIGRLRKN